MLIPRRFSQSAASLLALAAIVLFLAGCSGGDKGGGGTSSTGGNEPPKVELPPDPTLPGSGTSSGGEAPAPGGWGTLRGKFVYDAAEAPVQAKLSVTKDVEVCSKHNPLDESLVVNPDNKGIANIVVFLLPDDGQDVPVHESYEATAGDTVLLDNKDCRFDPHVCLLRTTQAFQVGNSDPVGHNTNIAATNNIAYNAIIPSNSKLDVNTFKLEERLPVQVNCNIHPWMSGRVVVRSNPYFTVSDENGEFEIANIPTNRWKFRVWHEKAAYVDNVTIDGKEEFWPKGIVEKDIEAGDANTLGEIKIKPEAFEK